jgi:aldehyde dehydrogenase (NAD+)
MNTNTITPTADLQDLVSRLRATYATGRTRSADWRIAQLTGIERLVEESEHQIAQAVAQDLGRPISEVWLTEIASTKGEAVYARKNVRRWMRRRWQPLPLTQLPGLGWIQCEPLGVVLVIGPWNYPVYLSLGPLVGAVAAGNCAVVKPSELAPATSSLISELVPRYLDPDAIAVVQGDGAVTQQLLAQGFDHAIFTGGTEIGKKIMAGAAPHLTPVTLELGGKSPVIVTRDADLDVTARRVAWVKLMNSGQTCIAPDYILADRSIRDSLVSKIIDSMDEFRRDVPDKGMRIVNQRQYARLSGYIEQTKGSIALGGGCDDAKLTIEPTVIVDPDPDEAVMRDEVFGPILPVLTSGTLDDTIAFINARPKPLAVYIFTRSKEIRDRILFEVPSGGAVVNHVAMHCLVPQLPFGGVGASGMGAYHGRWGFDAMSHRKSVLHKTFSPDLRFVYPPYTERATKLMRRLF